ncbi:MAG: hypothetical protein DWQ04_04355 [Chloroflexi bacterium]|nr:MAG: hypothetical protein DWQ04_04355 [Chloroflexota bacterium]
MALQMTTEQYMDSLGTVFEKYLNQDSGNKCYSLQTNTGPVWIKVLNLESTPLDNLHEIISFYNSCESRLIPKNRKLVELADRTVMQHDWVPGRVLGSPDEDRNDPQSTHWKFMELPVQKRTAVFEQILHFFVELEKKNLIIEDFYDGCIIYDFEKDEGFYKCQIRNHDFLIVFYVTNWNKLGFYICGKLQQLKLK